MASRGKEGKRLRQSAACSRKTRYETREQALAALNLVRTYHPDAPPVNDYACDVCRGFHIGKTPTNRRPDR